MTQKELEAVQFRLFSKELFEKEISFIQPPEPEPGFNKL
jgi:hypothetical protein